MFALMGLMDRDWYRDEIAQRKRCAERARRNARLRWLGTALGVGLMVLATLMTLPVVMTSRCSSAAWQQEPMTCWRYSWTAFSERVSNNMAASRGFPVIIVQQSR